ncbi:MAG TPA: transcription antitermination factor NusB [Burkholderiales bacterium]|nr:transcription antitermination factor NusB [Burkholderiales bacterium]
METRNQTRRRDNVPRKSTRRRSREFALQGLYQWLLAGTDAVVIATELAETEDFNKSDVAYFRTLLNGAIDNAAELESLIAPFLDRPVNELSPVERGILLLGGYELMRELEVPYRVVINEAVELAKVYGGTDGHKYVNGVLDKLAARLRDIEVGAERGA